MAGEHATVGWAKSQSYNLYAQIKRIYKYRSALIGFNFRLIRGLFCRYLCNAPGVFLELAGVIETREIFL